MAIRKLRRMGNPRLLEKAAPITDFQSTELQTIIDDLIENLRHYSGVGIAAPQIGYFVRIFILEMQSNERYPDSPSIPLSIFINPKITLLSEDMSQGWEGCLSVPGYRGLVPRYTHVKCQAYDRNGQPFEVIAKDFHARAIQHENDHLDGILYPMRMPSMESFACELDWWQAQTHTPYPESRKQHLREQFEL